MFLSSLYLHVERDKEESTRRRRDFEKVSIEVIHDRLSRVLPPCNPRSAQSLAAVSGFDPETIEMALTAFFGTLAGTVPIPWFFAPDNIGRIVGAALSRAA